MAATVRPAGHPSVDNGRVTDILELCASMPMESSAAGDVLIEEGSDPGGCSCWPAEA